jgi:hypothetical protein
MARNKLPQGVLQSCDNPEVINSLELFGCYFLSLCFVGNVDGYKIYELYKSCVKAGYLLEDCYVSNPVGILRLAGVQCIDVRFSSRFEYGKLNIVMTQKDHSTHFMVLDRDGQIAYNPAPDHFLTDLSLTRSFRVFEFSEKDQRSLAVRHLIS